MTVGYYDYKTRQFFIIIYNFTSMKILQMYFLLIKIGVQIFAFHTNIGMQFLDSNI